LPGTPYKTFIERKEIKKASKMKGKAGWKLKLLEAARKERKKEKIRKSKNVQGENGVFPCHLLPHLHQPFVRDVERHSRMAGSSAEDVWNGGMRIVPVQNEVAAPCGRSAKCNAYPLLHTCPLGRPK
jgi:hypothetical protein